MKAASSPLFQLSPNPGHEEGHLHPVDPLPWLAEGAWGYAAASLQTPWTRKLLGKEGLKAGSKCHLRDAQVRGF